MYICNSDAIIALIKLFIIYFHCELHHVVEETETHVFALFEDGDNSSMISNLQQKWER